MTDKIFKSAMRETATGGILERISGSRTLTISSKRNSGASVGI